MKNRTLKIKRLEIVALCLWPVVSSAISFVFKINSLESMVFFLLIPCAYLSMLLPKLIKKTLVFSIVTGLPIMTVLDYTMHATAQWFLPTAFPFRFLTLIPIEDLIWAVLTIYLVVMFYEYFLDEHRERKIWRPRMSYLATVLIVVLTMFLAVYVFRRALVEQIPYAYLIFGLVITFIPLIIESFRKPRLVPKLCAVTAMFFMWNLIYEVTALKLGWWMFPSHQYIGIIDFLGLT